MELQAGSKPQAKAKGLVKSVDEAIQPNPQLVKLLIFNNI
jgi:hypothetical protein